MWTEILSIVGTALATFLFGEKLYTWIFLKEDRRARQIQNRGEEATNESKAVETLQKALDLLQKLFENSQHDSEEKQTLIVSQQKELFREREDRAKISEELAVAKCRECRVHGCANREPQTGY